MQITKIKNSLKGLFPNFNQRIWGLEYEDIYIDGMTWRGIHIEKPFYYKGRFAVGLNRKFILDCWKSGVKKLIIFMGQIPPYSEYMMEVPNKTMLKWLEQQHQYEDKESKFEGGQPMRIYYIRI